jgi:hypothetical protein
VKDLEPKNPQPRFPFASLPSVMQNDIEQALVNTDTSVVIDKSELAKPVHAAREGTAKKHGSRYLYERVEQSNNLGNRLKPHEREFIGDRDEFYMTTGSLCS